MSANYADATISWNGNSITLLEFLKQQIDICENDTSRDDELSLWLQMAGEACEAYCDNVLASCDTTEQHPAKISPVALRYYPVSALNAVTVDAVDVTDDYEVFESEGVDYITSSTTGRTCPDGFKQMNIEYTAGYDPLPADLAYAITRTAINYDNTTFGTGVVKKESVVGVGSIEYATSDDTTGNVGAISSAAVSTLDKYKRRYC